MSETREASCQCGRLRVVAAGEPVHVSMCHCEQCQRRTGSAFALGAAFPVDQVEISGEYSDFARVSDDEEQREHVFHFCAGCGSQVFQTETRLPQFVIVAVGAFADPSFPPPTESGFEHRRHEWVVVPDTVQYERPELWDPVLPLYQARRYAEAADMGSALVDEHPGQGRLVYNTACCESLAGRPEAAVEHLRQAIEIWDGCREMAKGDSDFDPIRSDPAFVELTA